MLMTHDLLQPGLAYTFWIKKIQEKGLAKKKEEESKEEDKLLHDSKQNTEYSMPHIMYSEWTQYMV